MHDPLTAAEYKAIAAGLQLPTSAFIGGVAGGSAPESPPIGVRA